MTAVFIHTMGNISVKYKLFNSRLTAIISVSMVLFLLGIVSMVLFMSKNLSDNVKENFIFKLTIKEGVSQKDIEGVCSTLKAKPYIKTVSFVSKEQAVEELKAKMGEDPMEFLDVNPLPDCFEISLKADETAPDSLKRIETELEKIHQISQIDYPHELLDDFSHNINMLTVVFLLVAGLLMIISFALINNTIRLLIYSNRFLIHTMKQVGATRSFIRRPYMWQGLLIGLIASVLASVAMLALLFCMDDLTLFVDLHNPHLFVTVFGTIFASGLIITEISTYFAVNKYLRHSLNVLYAI